MLCIIVESYHGPKFTAKVEGINQRSEFDHMRPPCGYNITNSHSLSNEADGKSIPNWTCTSCGDMIKGSTKQKPSASNFCTEKTVVGKFCSNSSCHWHRHKKLCSGTYMLNNNGHKGKEIMLLTGSQDDKGQTFAASSSKRKLTARQLDFSNSTDNSASNVKRIKTTNVTNYEEKRNLPALSSSKRKLSEREIELKNIGVETPCQISKRPKITQIQREGKKVIQGSNEDVKEDKVYSWWSDGEFDEDVVPLINKRTERRKMEKLLKLQKLESANNTDKSSGDCVVYLSDDD